MGLALLVDMGLVFVTRDGFGDGTGGVSGLYAGNWIGGIPGDRFGVVTGDEFGVVIGDGLVILLEMSFV